MSTDALPPGHELADEATQAEFRLARQQLTLGQLLRSHRLGHEWTLTHAAGLLGVSAQLLHAYETGKKLPSPEVTYKMGQALGVVPEYAVLLVMNDQLKRANLPIQLTLKAS